MNKKTKGLLAGAAGAAILLGGSTFALWSDSERVNGGTITTGNLDVEVVGDLTWFDVSEDRTDAGHEIKDLSDFRIIPGDTIEGTIGLEAALEGENMVAALGVNSTSLEDSILWSVIDVTLTISDANGEVLSHDWKGAPVEVLFASDDNGNPFDLPVLPVDTDGTAEFTVTISATFDEDTSDQDFVQASAALGNVTISLDQVRADAPGYDG